MERERIARVVENMKREGLSQIIVTATESIFYLTGFWIEPHERMFAFYMNLEGSGILFGNEIFGIVPKEGEIYISHTDSENPVLALSKVLLPGKIGIDKFWSSKFLIGLMELRKDCIPVLGSGPVDRARMYKDRKEQEAMRRASSINDEVITAAVSAIQEGCRENELASLVNRLFLERGADCEGVQLVCFGKNGADPHHAGDNTVIQPGDSVIFDLFTPIGRYWCDMTRTVFYKQVSEKQQEVYHLVRQANEAAEAVIAPGRRLCDIDKAAREVIAQAGYGQYFTHRLGHNIGLSCHEPPDVSAAWQEEVRPGMVFSIEPGIYLPGEFGVRIEDLVLVTENGCEVLNHASKELQVVS